MTTANLNVAEFPRENGPSLGRPGRFAVVTLGSLAMIVALPGGIGFLQVAPYAVVGALLAIRRPRNPVSWLLIGLAWAFAGIAISVPASETQLLTGTLPPLPMALAVAQSTAGAALLVLWFAIAILFPTGRFPTGRLGQLARTALWLLVLFVVLGTLTPTITITPAGSQVGINVPNPVAILPNLPIWTLFSAGVPVMFTLLVAAVGSMIVRLRRAVGIERAQLRWLVWSLAFILLGFLIGLVGDVVSTTGFGGLVWLPAEVAFPLPAVAIGIAILRYRLYEIDRIISRTISYGVVTLVLASVFVVVVLAARAVLDPLTGSGTIGVAGSTLLAAALFQPIRRRVQRLVDQRFNRSRYNADGIVVALAKRLGDEVDLEALRLEIRATVSAAVEPISVSLWLRE